MYRMLYFARSPARRNWPSSSDCLLFKMFRLVRKNYISAKAFWVRHILPPDTSEARSSIRRNWPSNSDRQKEGCQHLRNCWIALTILRMKEGILKHWSVYWPIAGNWKIRPILPGVNTNYHLRTTPETTVLGYIWSDSSINTFCAVQTNLMSENLRLFQAKCVALPFETRNKFRILFFYYCNKYIYSFIYIRLCDICISCTIFTKNAVVLYVITRTRETVIDWVRNAVQSRYGYVNFESQYIVHTHHLKFVLTLVGFVFHVTPYE